jgi:hypothetical protein
MPENIYPRLRRYYLKCAEVLRGEADAASVFPNATDVGGSRERIYAEFLRQHAPSKCNIFFGGCVFDDAGNASDQLDIIVTTDTAPAFNLHNADGHGKSIASVEGTLAVFSIKSTLDKKEIYNALKGIASIPPTKPLSGRANPMAVIANYDEWPLKVVYAIDGVSLETAVQHLESFYQANPGIPNNRRPNFIHVSGKYLIARQTSTMTVCDVERGTTLPIPVGCFFKMPQPDLAGIAIVLRDLQQYAVASSHIHFNYTDMVNKVLDPRVDLE